jgi:hypothetical protein
MMTIQIDGACRSDGWLAGRLPFGLEKGESLFDWTRLDAAAAATVRVRVRIPAVSP